VLGKAALRDSVLQRDLSRTAVLAFATHGLQPGELPGLDEPALAMTLPPGETQSPLLTLSDVLSLRLDADWVLLSACNTAGADGEAAEALSGLGRGFFFAGARALLVTHWPVESSSARQLVSALFTQSGPSASRAEALRHAQRALMRKGAGNAYSYAHPLFWAPFALVGDGGMSRSAGLVRMD
jgi:CHAT domain-containing protein